jgi:hypothetical protein
VKSTLHRALARLRHELEHGGYGYRRNDPRDCPPKENVCAA